MTDLNNHINNYIKRKHSMYHNCQEAFVRMNIKARPNYIMSTENTLKYKDRSAPFSGKKCCDGKPSSNIVYTER